MKSTKQIIVQGTKISLLLRPDNNDYISLTDMAKKFGDDVLIYQWMRNRNTVEFLGIWERMHNTDFKGIEFETFKKQAGMNSFSLTPRKWVKATKAIGVLFMFKITVICRKRRLLRYSKSASVWCNYFLSCQMLKC